MTREYAEKITLGSAICFDECWNKAKPLVRDSLFGDERNKFIWNVLSDMKSEGLDVDVMSLWLYTLGKYPQIQNPVELAAYICEVTLVVSFKEYDKVLSELLRFYSMEIKRYGR